MNAFSKSSRAVNSIKAIWILWPSKWRSHSYTLVILLIFVYVCEPYKVDIDGYLCIFEEKNNINIVTLNDDLESKGHAQCLGFHKWGIFRLEVSASIGGSGI